MPLRFALLTALVVTVIFTADPTAADAKPTWGVTYKGNVNVPTGMARMDGTADAVLADMLSKVLNTEVKSTPWEKADAQNLFLITSKENAPAAVAAKLEGKQPDAFVIQYPVEVDGKTVCILCTQDDQAYDYPVYAFLRRFMGVEWVGPGEIGQDYVVQPDWNMPASIDVFDEPDYVMRLWTGQSFSSRPWLARQARMGFHHALGSVFAPAKYAESDPDVYPLIDGKRFVPDPTKAHSAGWQPCLFNPKSIRIATEHVKEQLAKGSIAVSLSVNDGAGNECECDLCTAQDAKAPPRSPRDKSDRYFRFYNTVMENVLTEYPKGHIAVLGYGPCSMPPVETKINPSIMILKVSASPEELRAWGDAGAGPNLYMWLWEGGFLTMRPDMHPMIDLVKSCHEMGGIALYSEIIANWVFSAPKFYILANVLWDTSRDVDELLAHYCLRAYGPKAGPSIERYIRRWWQVYMRQEYPYRTVEGWRHSDQLKHLTRSDLLVLNDAIEEASRAEMNEKQRTRFGFMQTYHTWLALNAEQWLTAQDMQDDNWVKYHSPDGIVAALDATYDLTPRFNAMWKDTIYPDTTGWLIDAYYSLESANMKRDYWQDFTAQLRNMVDSSYESAVYDAMCAATDRMTEEKALDYWQQQKQDKPHLAPWIDAQIRRLNGEGGKNVVINGSFENSENGDPPAIEGWQVYEQYGMVAGTRGKYNLSPGHGRDGSRAMGIGEGPYPELRSFIKLEGGRRYRISFWYKTENREKNGTFFIYKVNGGMDQVRPDVSRFFAQTCEPTDGEWVRVVRIIAPEETSDYMIMLSFYYQGETSWVWFDDIDITPL